ncbi:AP2 domain transcription factor AP2XII-5, partial [Toxoplasma gondii ARI]
GASHGGSVAGPSAPSPLLRSRRPWGSSGAASAGPGDSWAREAAQLPLYAGMQYDAVSKCFRVKLQSHRRAFSVVRRGVREAHLLAVEALKNDGSLQEEDEEDFRAFYSGRPRRSGAPGPAGRPGGPGDAERGRPRSAGRIQDEGEEGYREMRSGRCREREEEGAFSTVGGREGAPFRDSLSAYGSAGASFGGSHSVVTRGSSYYGSAHVSSSLGTSSRYERGGETFSRGYGSLSHGAGADSYGSFSNGLASRRVEGRHASQKGVGAFSASLFDEDDDDAFAPLGGLALTKNAISICLTDLRDACLALCFSTVAEQEERRRMVQQHIFHVQDAGRKEMILPYLHLFECLLLLNQLPHEIEVPAQRILFSALDMHARAAVHTYFPNYFRKLAEGRTREEDRPRGRVAGRGVSLGAAGEAKALADELMLDSEDAGFPK